MGGQSPLQAGVVLLATLAFCATASNSWGPADIKRVHVVFSNHLDVGFDGLGPKEIGFAFTIINKYFDEYFARGMNTSAVLRQRDPPYRYVYTTQAYLTSLYLDCIDPSRWTYPAPGLQANGPRPPPLHCPDAAARQALIDGVKRGDIWWHAFPFNSEPEVYDHSLFQSSVNLAKDLARSLGRPAPKTLSQRGISFRPFEFDSAAALALIDGHVPGMTRGVIPLLSELGIEAISVGVNGGSSPPAGGYGGIEVSDCVIVPGLDHALALAWKGDNQGPHTVDEALAVFQQLEKEFPNAVVQGSTFDEFVEQLKTVRTSLPVIESEIGDTWIYGVASDPLKLAQFREVLRLRRACLAARSCSPSDAAFREFDRLLTKVGEHTWGVDVKTFLNDFTHWSNSEFEAAKNGSNFALMVNSWIEQRSFITNALRALSSSDKYEPLARTIEANLQALKPKGPPNPQALGYAAVAREDWARVFQCGELVLAFDPTNGAINYLYDKAKRAQWANGATCHSLGLFQYSTYDQGDYTNYIGTYGYLQPPPEWFAKDFGKPGVESARPLHGFWLPRLEAMWTKSSSAGWHFLLRLGMANGTAWREEDKDKLVKHRLVSSTSSVCFKEAVCQHIEHVGADGLKTLRDSSADASNLKYLPASITSLDLAYTLVTEYCSLYEQDKINFFFKDIVRCMPNLRFLDLRCGYPYGSLKYGPCLRGKVEVLVLDQPLADDAEDSIP
ncbi:uncharacterized protein ACA1_138180 [Acanthamoeba castellanii str. Neff]|uniref:Glycoside hydrolase family 38 N-terminal domain-containing protein n=1 Tax=Acanthamoeba castellanii (strain ATCC 30010 / Neff) TaxID=1257118 RepID=L8H1Z8_ACACF|nr:uncharacterized protein ACA1_138180 [Acanthamoeba castellanii str. Neff]ELR18406.1 hypothetical protein ACA1_138180 [Acanthamoeba castellanii str. Neff]